MLWCLIYPFTFFYHQPCLILLRYKGAKEAFSLILRNILRISAVSLVSEFVLLLGKMFIVLSSTIGAYLYMDQYFAEDLNGLYIATTLTFLTSYATAAMFNEVFGMSISTILQCFVTDEEMHEVSLHKIVSILCSQFHFLQSDPHAIFSSRTGSHLILLQKQLKRHNSHLQFPSSSIHKKSNTFTLGGTWGMLISNHLKYIIELWDWNRFFDE